MSSTESGSVFQTLTRGLRRRCPRCGCGRLFTGWYQLAESCDQCDLKYEPLEGNSYWFMYYSTAGFTGFIIIAMLLIQPENIWLARAVVLTAAVIFIVFTLPYRKGLAIAVDYLSERKHPAAHKAESPPDYEQGAGQTASDQQRSLQSADAAGQYELEAKARDRN